MQGAVANPAHWNCQPVETNEVQQAGTGPECPIEHLG
jgi:hypothetical protein